MFNPLTVFSANQFKIYRFDILLMRNADLGRKQPEKTEEWRAKLPKIEAVDE
jgi:hypothetical protein